MISGFVDFENVANTQALDERENGLRSRGIHNMGKYDDEAVFRFFQASRVSDTCKKKDDSQCPCPYFYLVSR